MAVRACFALLILLPFVVAAPTARATGRPEIAALQVALRAKGLYGGTVDGVWGAQTAVAVMRFQRRTGLTVDGVVGPRTRRRLGRFGRPRLGSRILARGMVGWDVASLQFHLAWRGFRSGDFDGQFGDRLHDALRRYQRWAGLTADGRAGPATVASFRRPLPRSPLALAWPMQGPPADRFGPRGDRFHSGIDFPAPTGAPVQAAATGRVAFAGRHPLGYGLMVGIDHGRGVKTRYAHLSRILVSPGERVASGERVGLVGSTGFSTGPHLHFEVRVRGAAVDPLTALP